MSQTTKIYWLYPIYVNVFVWMIFQVLSLADLVLFDIFLLIYYFTVTQAIVHIKVLWNFYYLNASFAFAKNWKPTIFLKNTLKWSTFFKKTYFVKLFIVHMVTWPNYDCWSLEPNEFKYSLYTVERCFKSQPLLWLRIRALDTKYSSISGSRSGLGSRKTKLVKCLKS